VSPAFPGEGQASSVGALVGAVAQLRRVGRNTIVRGRIPHEAEDVPQHEFVLGPPYQRPLDVGAVRAAASSSSSTTSSADGCKDCP
jgi:hypothetical protein